MNLSGEQVELTGVEKGKKCFTEGVCGARIVFANVAVVLTLLEMWW